MLFKYLDQTVYFGPILSTQVKNLLNNFDITSFIN